MKDFDQNWRRSCYLVFNLISCFFFTLKDTDDEEEEEEEETDDDDVEEFQEQEQQIFPQVPEVQVQPQMFEVAVQQDIISSSRDLLSDWPEMPYLKKLTFSYVDKIILGGIKNLCAKCPQLNTLHLADLRPTAADQILIILGNELHYLISLKYHISINSSQKELIPEALDILVQCSKRLKTLELRNQLGVPNWKISQLFQQSSSLRLFTICNTYRPTRIMTQMDRISYQSSHVSA